MVFVVRRQFAALAPAAIAERQAAFEERAALRSRVAAVKAESDPFLRRRAQQEFDASLRRARR